MRPVMLTSPVLTKVTVFAVFSLLVTGAQRTAGHHATFTPRPLDIQVQVNAFGKASQADITAVLYSASSELWRYCPGTQLDGIDVYHRTDHPQTDFKRTPSGRISIGLSSEDTYWAQYSFQFAHEFCHTLANFGNNPRQSVRYPRTANLWLEESLCETASLFTLRAMSRSWQTAPPFPAWRGYSTAFNAYVVERLARPEHHLPGGMPFLVWFQENQYALRQNPAMRERNTIIAIQLLPIFEAEPSGWETLLFLNRGSSDANQSLARHLAEWRSRCPKVLRPFISRLAAVFAVKL
jgi:hypothetical protein